MSLHKKLGTIFLLGSLVMMGYLCAMEQEFLYMANNQKVDEQFCRLCSMRDLEQAIIAVETKVKNMQKLACGHRFCVACLAVYDKDKCPDCGAFISYMHAKQEDVVQHNNQMSPAHSSSFKGNILFAGVVCCVGTAALAIMIALIVSNL